MITFLFSILAFGMQSAEKWLAQADSIRNPAESYVMKIEVLGDDQRFEFEVYLLGKDRTLIVTKSPATDRGRNMLMIGQDYHAYVPNLKRSVRLSLSQKLTGLVAHGDIARTRWFGDYRPKVEFEDENLVILFLEAMGENLTYQKIRLKLDKKAGGAPLQAEYLSLDGKKILKTAYFEDYGLIHGVRRPRQIRIETVGQKSSTIRVIAMDPKNLTDSFFSLSQLERIR